MITLVAQMLDDLDQRWPGSREQLAQDPLAFLQGLHVLQIKVVSNAVQENSNLAGSYDGNTDPPMIQIEANAVPGRKAFTALHELGHYLHDISPELVDLIVQIPSDLIDEEVEKSCDEFAAAILIPQSATDEAFADGVTAPGVVNLIRATRASLQANGVAAVRYLATSGHVLLLNSDGVVISAMTRGFPPVTVGSCQSDLDPIARVLNGLDVAKGRGRFGYRDGIRGQDLYVQAARHRSYIVVVAVAEKPPWVDEYVLPTFDGGPTSAMWVCEHCDAEYESFMLACARCGQPECSECGRCGCAPRIQERVCTACNLLLPARMFEAASASCRDCS